MNYLSVCSGIEAATVAWHPLGWTPFGFSQFDPEHNYKNGPDFPSSLLAHHYGSNLPGEPWSGNAPPNFGDMTRFEEWPDAAIDLLVGGTPCQDFSIAGLRAGMDGVRGNLTLTYSAIARRYRPKRLVWENVPGVLSSNAGRDFASLLGLLAGRRIEIPVGGWQSAGIVEGDARAYGLAWRVLDAQFIRVDGFGRAVPQRRRRVFVVGYLGDWRRAAAVLLERESLCGNPAPRREAGKEVAPTISARTKGGGGLGSEFDCDGGLIASTGDVSHCLNAGGMGRIDYETETMVAHALRADGFDAGEDGTGRGTPLVPVVFDCKAGGNTSFSVGEVPGALRGEGHGGGHIAVAFDMRGRDGGAQFEGPHDTANIRAASGGSSRSYVAEQWAVRRLMPVECERLQGFRDGYTDIPFRNKPAADGPRYKSLGNSMAVNVMRWIGRRIEMVDAL